MNRVVIVDYGMCNLDSIARAIEECGGRSLVTADPRELKEATQIILPGVGAFANAMQNLHERGLVSALQDQVIGNHIPFLGICLGMQLMATCGHESGVNSGLGWIDGEVVKLEPKGQDRRIPHIGWNNIELVSESPLFKDVAPDRDFYFVHSYHVKCTNVSQIVTRTPYAGGFVSAVGYDHIFGVQFHPEKSQKAGFQMLRNFLAV
jgi:glutamine amidotransferase